MATELVSKGGQQLVGEVVLTTRAEPFVQRSTEDGSRNGLVDGRLHGPAPFAGVRHAATEIGELG